jgi:hypothetical protein
MWIITWQRISPEVIVKSFKNCCIPNAMDEKDDDYTLRKVSEDDVHVGKGCEKDEDTDCEDEDTDCEDGDSDND